MKAIQGGIGGEDKGRDGAGKGGGEEGEREREMAKAALTIAELGQWEWSFLSWDVRF